MIAASDAEPEVGVYLRSYLAPLAPYLTRGDVTDIYVNRPGEVWIETLGGDIERHDAPALDHPTLVRLTRQVAAYSNQAINREHPLLSATLPDGARLQVVAPPATRGAIALAIRKHVSSDLGLVDYVSADAFAGLRCQTNLDAVEEQDDVAVQLAKSPPAEALALSVRQRRNILVSGGTSSGKTTLLNALMREIPATERLILIEDTPELILRHRNAVGLLSARGALGEADVTTDDLVSAALRMRPDRIIMGELRGPEAVAFLRAINTGHPGSLATVHADSPEGAVEQIALLALQAGVGLRREDVKDMIRHTIGVFVQVERRGGRRVISKIVVPTRT